jgi:carotenoid cleavage dioxygenase-like enzyme
MTDTETETHTGTHTGTGTEAAGATAGEEAAGDETPPLMVAGHMVPVPDEIEAFDLEVEGALPPELNGRYIRNGPNPPPGSKNPHVFTGAGMLHGVRIAGGKARWYRNRWVRTSKLAGAERERPDGTRDLAVNAANTHLIEHGGKLLALCEGGLPYRITGELETVGAEDFGGLLETAMTAHPKEDPGTGRLHFFGVGLQEPALTYHRLSADGELEFSRSVEVPAPTMMHDFAITEHHVVWLDLPAVFDRELLGKAMPVRWNEAYGARLGVMDKSGLGEVRWFEIEPCYVFHVGNAREDDHGRIVLDAVRYDRGTWDATWPVLGGRAEPQEGGTATGTVLHRWIIDPAAGTVSETQLDDLVVEFPTLNENRTGRRHRYQYLVSQEPAAAVVRYDVASGARESYELGARWTVGEAVFVPSSEAGVPGQEGGEDEGWLMSVTTDVDGTASELIVLDASEVSAGPVARVRLPRAVPSGFHGSWIAE